MGNQLSNRLGTLFGLEKQGTATPAGAVVEGDGVAGASTKYTLIESRPLHAKGPVKGSAVKPNQSLRETSTGYGTTSLGDAPNGGGRLSRVRSFFLRSSPAKDPPDTVQRDHRPGGSFHSRSGSRRRFRFYTIRRRQQEQQEVDGSQGREGTTRPEGTQEESNQTLLPAGHSSQRTNQWIHRLPAREIEPAPPELMEEKTTQPCVSAMPEADQPPGASQAHDGSEEQKREHLRMANVYG
ncbi:hypothetical protein ZHAS_00001031 [Anopheles sinensis]|uniref:Uncharacterized protein n=1 Tax=Anopheles sinensis TaxID=74873 RepID=A0A084VAY2_ANOSI|nr:hypothetical protein ZHAS_00001031 [Anopheles sinensis]